MMMWQRHKDSLSAHFCETYVRYLGAKDRKDRAHCFSCTSCKDSGRKSVSRLLSKGCFFLIFDIGKQIYDVVSASANLLYEHLRRGVSPLHEEYGDISDEGLHKSIRRNVGATWSDLTLTLNTGGFPVFSSSKASV